MKNTTMNTGAASLSDERERAAITACALMIKGICLTRPNAEWTGAIEDRIQFMLKQMQAGAAIAAGGAQEAVGSERKAETATLILRGELVNVGIDESGIGDMELIVGARGALLSGLSQEETKALAPFLFQQVTLAVAYNGEQEVQS